MMCNLTVVIPFRNRDGLRLRRACESILAGSLKPAITVVDFGSENPEVASGAVSDMEDVDLIYVESSVWNKSEAVNIGIEQATTERILVSDADLVWTKHAIENGYRISELHSAAVAFDVRYLRQDTPDELLTLSDLNPSSLQPWSDINPRWGDGICLFSKRDWRKLGGYDERMSIYGYEDNDFTSRLRKSGTKTIWADFATCPVYHVWHKPVGKVVAKENPAVARAYGRNRQLFKNDRSVVRNVSSWRCGEAPLVSVVIATAGRSEFLRESIASILCQSVQSFEVIVVDDGQLDATEAVVREFADSRIVYIGLPESRGISAARNIGGARARGEFLAVMDDDDICLPDRFEVSLSAIAGGVDGCVGGFVTFYDESGEVLSWDDPLPTLEGAFAKGGFSGHPTWMIRRSVFNSFSYDESFTSAVDNNRALRMLTSGVRLVHTGRPHILRRVHEGQVSNRDQQFQGFGAVLDKTWLWSGYRRSEWQALVEKSTKSAPRNRATLYESVFIPYLPDSLVHREVDVIVWDEKSSDFVKTLDGYSQGVEVRHGRNFLYGKYRVGGSWMTMARLAQRGLKYSVSVLEPTEKLTHKKYVPTHPEFSASIPWRRIGKSERPIDVIVRTVENALGKERLIGEKSVEVSSLGAKFSENAMAEFLVGEE